MKDDWVGKPTGKMERMNKKRTWLIVLRVILGLLILCNMAAIFLLSHQGAAKSDNTSRKLGYAITDSIGQPYQDKTIEQKQFFQNKVLPAFRDFAHMAEFGCLSALIYLFLLTWRGAILSKYFISMGCGVLYALSDEVHQYFVPGRTMELVDVALDSLGVLLFTSVVLLAVYVFSIWQIKTTKHTISAPDGVRLRLAVVSDLHGNDPTLPLSRLQAAAPDVILVAGDLMNGDGLRDENASGYAFLRACCEIAPTYYSLGNHEIDCHHKGNPWRKPTPRPLDDAIRARVAQTGAILLENTHAQIAPDVYICGLSSGINGDANHPDKHALEKFNRLYGYRILMCHHPEYFTPYIAKTSIELTVCGHAHGGHWRFFGRGVYAPGQGLFPKYTAGVVDGRCVISRGLGNHTWIPRIFNTPELVVIELVPDAQQK